MITWTVSHFSMVFPIFLVVYGWSIDVQWLLITGCSHLKSRHVLAQGAHGYTTGHRIVEEPGKGASRKAREVPPRTGWFYGCFMDV